MLRAALATCQALAIGVTWQLWQVRTAAGEAPNLPIIETPWVDALQIDFGWLLMASLVLTVFRPTVGVAAHGTLLALAIAFDQMRIQPEFVSVAILLIGTLPARGTRQLARCHLISLWIWAGIHKLFSSGYWLDTGPRMWTDTIGGLSRETALGLAGGAAVFELTLGLLAAWPGTRRFVPWLAAVLHAGILLSLLVQKWNPAVWPWNIAVIIAAADLFRQDKQPKPPVILESPWLKRSWAVACAVLLLHPGFYYLGLADAYVSWCVYSSNTPSATLYEPELVLPLEAAIFSGQKPDRATLDQVLESAEGEDLQFRYYASINVPFSPAPRLFAQYFRRRGQPGQLLVIHDPRPAAAWRHRQQVILVITADREVVAW
jgi:hypothetical protein